VEEQIESLEELKDGEGVYSEIVSTCDARSSLLIIIIIIILLLLLIIIIVLYF
jgi:type IV secretory pathway component VirB8